MPSTKVLPKQDLLVEGKYARESIYKKAESVVATKTTGTQILDREAQRRLPTSDSKCLQY